MKGIDKDPSTFDPTAGDSPALTRNNKDQVWVPQVRADREIGSHRRVFRILSNTFLILFPIFNSPINFHREPAHAATARMLP
jgi:hypothetical protein